MTQVPGPSELDQIPPRRSAWRNLSIVWLVPVLALAVSLGVAWRTYSDRGVPIDILFQNASGVTAGETGLRYRDVVIGMVEHVGFTSDLENVKVTVRVDKDIAPFLDDSAEFWVVRPEVSAQGISGLSTVLSGVYIEGSWDSEPGVERTRFTGLEERPKIGQQTKGTRITLRAPDGNMIRAGVPVFYRGIAVGRTETPKLDETGSVVLIEALIEAPHDRLLTSATRFWDTSGFSVSLGAGGLKLDVGSFAALLTGGVAFNTFFSGGEPIEAGHVYDVFAHEEEARQNIFLRDSADLVAVAMILDGGVSGLAQGAPLEYEGLRIGEVSAISAFVTGEGATPDVNQHVNLVVDPELLGLPAGSGKEEVLDFLEAAVEGGLRARVNSANLLGTSLIVELVEIEDAEPAVLDRDAKPYPIIPSVETDLPDINASLEGVMRRINGLKVEELIQQAISVMASIEAIATDQDTRAAPGAIVDLVNDTRTLLTREDTQALPGELRGTVESLRTVLDRITAEGIVARIRAVLEQVDTGAANFAAASDEFPALVEDLRAVAAKANELEAEELIASAKTFLDGADALLGTEEARAVPPALSAALDEMRRLLSELREGGAVDNANSALASANAAAESLERATADLPALSQRLDGLVARSEELIASYGARSDFNQETLNMLREIRAAARTVTSLARAIERNPNSILFGR